MNGYWKWMVNGIDNILQVKWLIIFTMSPLTHFVLGVLLLITGILFAIGVAFTYGDTYVGSVRGVGWLLLCIPGFLLLTYSIYNMKRKD